MISIGQQFVEERQKKGLSISEVARATKIREEFLCAIEKGDYKKLPSSAYAYGFVRNYAKFLGLPVDRSLAIFRREFDDKKTFDVLPRGLSDPKKYNVSKVKFGRSAILIGFLAVLVLGFLLFQYRSALFNPSLKINYPTENATINSLTIEVRGKTDPDTTLTIGNEVVSIDDNGNFKKQITVFPGSTSINFRVENKFGKVTQTERRIIVKPGS